MNSIHSNAQIGEGTTIGAFSVVEENVKIGDNCWIGPNVTIMDGARIGDNCRVFPGAVISAIPQDLKYKGEDTLAEIGSNTTIRECVTINKGTTDRNTTKVGDNCLLMAYVHIAHDTFVGNNCIIANSANIAGHVDIEDWVIIEGVVAIQQFVTIGQHAFIGGGSHVRKNVPPFIKAAREPLSYVGVNSIGLRRRGFKNDVVTSIEDIYRALYVHNNNITQAVKAAEMELPSSKSKDLILNFIRHSDKGIIRGPF